MPDKKTKIRGNDPALNERKLGKGERAVEIDGEFWSFRVGKSYVVIRDPNGHGTQVEMLDRDGEMNLEIGIAQGGMKMDFDEQALAVTPGTVEAYIRKHLRGAN